MAGELIYEATVRVKATKLAGLQEFYNYVFDMPMRLEDPELRMESLHFELQPGLANQLALSMFAEKTRAKSNGR